MHGRNQKRNGGLKMPERLIKIEIERIVNLVAGFGWTKSEEKVSAGEVSITFIKKVPVTTEPE